MSINGNPVPGNELERVRAQSDTGYWILFLPDSERCAHNNLLSTSTFMPMLHNLERMYGQNSGLALQLL